MNKLAAILILSTLLVSIFADVASDIINNEFYPNEDQVLSIF